MRDNLPYFYEIEKAYRYYFKVILKKRNSFSNYITIIVNE
jgi:hypothetical protein